MKKRIRHKKKAGRRLNVRELNKKLLKILLFLVKFNLFAIPLYLVILSGFQFEQLMEATAGIVYSMLKLTGIEASIENIAITVPTKEGIFVASIDWDCTGWKSMFALFALIFATDFPIRRKLAGMVLLPVVYFINLIRIWFMFYFVSAFGTDYYSIIHAFIWSWGLLAAVMILWIIWMKKDISNLKIFTKIK